ncbi:MAG: hypothetical protein ACJAVR_002569 [Paracoccaceae bacterium]|jgi:hypothetical protein
MAQKRGQTGEDTAMGWIKDRSHQPGGRKANPDHDADEHKAQRVLNGMTRREVG